MEKKKSFAAMSTLIFLAVMAGCSGSAEHEETDGPGQVDETVEAGPALCNFTGEDTDSDGSAGYAPMNVTCIVGIGNAVETHQAIDDSVTGILSAYVFRDMCKVFPKEEVEVSFVGFDAMIRAGLKARLENVGIKWTVESVKCGFSAAASSG